MDVDKDDLKRYGDFVSQKVHDLLIIGQATAKANGRDIIEFSDLPITKGLQESIHDFKGLEQEISCSPSWSSSPHGPHWICSPARRRKPSSLPLWVGSVWHWPAPSRSSSLISRIPGPDSGERAFRIFNLLL